MEIDVRALSLPNVRPWHIRCGVSNRDSSVKHEVIVILVPFHPFQKQFGINNTLLRGLLLIDEVINPLVPTKTFHRLPRWDEAHICHRARATNGGEMDPAVNIRQKKCIVISDKADNRRCGFLLAADTEK